MKKKHGLMTKELKKKLRKSRNDNEILENLAAASNELDDDDLFLVTGGAYQVSDGAPADTNLFGEVQPAQPPDDIGDDNFSLDEYQTPENAQVTVDTGGGFDIMRLLGMNNRDQ